jgi:hypothetical protein
MNTFLAIHFGTKIGILGDSFTNLPAHPDCNQPTSGLRKLTDWNLTF